MSENIGRKTIAANHRLDPVFEEELSLSYDEDIVNEVEELENSGSECANATLGNNANDIAREQEAADEKGIDDNVEHEDVF